MSFNLYKKDFYTSPRHLSILRESPEDMFLNGERSEDIYVNFDDRSIVNSTSLPFTKPLPTRPTKPPPPLPISAPTYIQPIHPPVPIKVNTNLVTMVTTSTQTVSNSTGTSCIEGNVPDILSFTLNHQSDMINLNSNSPTFPKETDSSNIVDEYQCIDNFNINYPQDLVTSISLPSNFDLESFMTKYNDLMHDSLSWTVASAKANDTINAPCDSQLDISRFELRRNAEKEFYRLLHDHINVTWRKYYLNIFSSIQQIRNYCETLRVIAQYHSVTELSNYLDYEPGEATCNLMKMSFNENYRRIICQLGGLKALVQLIVINDNVLGDLANNYHLTVRRYACMALTNLTFGINENKVLLCSIPSVLITLSHFLSSFSEDVKQVAASVIRNLSWKANDEIKLCLRETNITKILTYESMKCVKESCLKSLLSALWNISAHSKENKNDICEVNGALAYFVDILNFKNIALVENSGGILRNVSSVITTNEVYRNILRQNNAIPILLKQLRSTSLTIVGNSCGTLCNLSVDCPEDQQLLWDLGAVGMLKNLAHSKHRTISSGSAATLKNLLSARASLKVAEHTLINALKSCSTTSSSESSPQVQSPLLSLHVRKLHALESDIENILRNNHKITLSPDIKKSNKISHLHRQSWSSYNYPDGLDNSDSVSCTNNSSTMKRSGSDESMISAHSDLTFDKPNFPSTNAKLKNASISFSKQDKQPGCLMSLSGYSNSSGHYDLTIEQCMKISNFSTDTSNSYNCNVLDHSTSIMKQNNSLSNQVDTGNLYFAQKIENAEDNQRHRLPVVQNRNDQTSATTQTNVLRNIINIPPPSIKEKSKNFTSDFPSVHSDSRMSPLSEFIDDELSDNYNTIQYLSENSCSQNHHSIFVPLKHSDLNNNSHLNLIPKLRINPESSFIISRSNSGNSLEDFHSLSMSSSIQSEYPKNINEDLPITEISTSLDLESELNTLGKSNFHKTLSTKSNDLIFPKKLSKSVHCGETNSFIKTENLINTYGTDINSCSIEERADCIYDETKPLSGTNMSLFSKLQNETFNSNNEQINLSSDSEELMAISFENLKELNHHNKRIILGQIDDVSTTTKIVCSTFMNKSANLCYPAIVPHKSHIANISDVNIGKAPQFCYYDMNSDQYHSPMFDTICPDSSSVIKVSTDIYPKPAAGPPKPPKRTTSTLSSMSEKFVVNKNESETEHSKKDDTSDNGSDKTAPDCSRDSSSNSSSLILITTNSNSDCDEEFVKEVNFNQEPKFTKDEGINKLKFLKCNSVGTNEIISQHKEQGYHHENYNIQNKSAGRPDLEHKNKQDESVVDHLKMKDDIYNSRRQLYSMLMDSEKHWKHNTDNKSISRSGIPTIIKKSRLSEARRSLIPISKTSLNKSAFERSVTSYPKSKSNSELRSAMDYNSVFDSNKTHHNLVGQNYKLKKFSNEPKKRHSFQMNKDFDENSKDFQIIKTANPSEDAIAFSQSQYSDISIDNNTYSIKDSNTINQQIDMLSEADTLELIEINELLDDDFLLDMSSSMEIDAACYRNPTSQGSGDFTDDDFTNEDLIDALHETQKQSSKSFESLMKDETMQSFLALKDYVRVKKMGNYAEKNSNLNAKVSYIVSAVEENLQKPKNEPKNGYSSQLERKCSKLKKCASSTRSISPIPPGIRRLKNSSNMQTSKTPKPIASINNDLQSTYLKKSLSSKIKNPPTNKNFMTNSLKTVSNESIIEMMKTSSTFSKSQIPTNVSSNHSYNSLERKQKRTSKIPSLSSSSSSSLIDSKINTQRKMDSKTKQKVVKLAAVKVRNNIESNKNESLSNNNIAEGTISDNLNDEVVCE